MSEDEMTFYEFKELYYDKVSKTGRLRRAYVEAEEEHERQFHKRKYSSLQSFRVQLSKRRK